MGANLVTRAEYKAYVGITSPNQDAVIDAIIPKVSALVKNICRRTFVDYVDDPKVEYFDQGQYFSLQEYPVIGVPQVECSIDYGQTYFSLVEYEDFVKDSKTGDIKPISMTEFPYRVNGYKVTYNAGFDVLPEDLKIAVLDLVTYYVKNDAAVHSPKAPGTNTVQIEYITSNSLPAHIKRVLDLYAANYL